MQTMSQILQTITLSIQYSGTICIAFDLGFYTMEHDTIIALLQFTTCTEIRIEIHSWVARKNTKLHSWNLFY